MKPRPSNLFRMIVQDITRKKKLIERRKRLLKMKFLICIILPAVVVVLTVKVIKTYLAVKLKDVVIPGLITSSVPHPIKQQVLKRETVTKEPAGETYEPILINQE